ncbi:MAG TPA: S8 family serine peptidase [Steroidobacteraceae bacterium]|nr:S8 family serine peptidase [Steroidobacteraceae bacterium]
MAAILVLAGPAQGQVRLPGVQLPDPLQSLQRGIAQADSTTVDKLRDARRLAVAALIRSNPQTVAADPHGDAIVRDEILAYAPSEAELAAARALGFDVLREQSEAELEWRLVVLRKPRNLSNDQALRRLRAADPTGTYEYNHLYGGSGSADAAAAAERGAAPPDAVGADAAVSLPDARVGLIDTGVDLTHPVFNGTVAHRWGCDDRVIPAAHGTAVASLLVGRAAEFHGVLPRAELYAADVYCGAPTGGAVDALAGAFGWMVRERIAVINVSLVGPDNAILARIVASLTARGYAIVAAVGNDGPAAPPLYPASYPHVIGVTGVDARHRVLLEAARGAQVMFAAPGADMAAGAPASAYVAVRGTSFAAPIVAALLAQRLSQPGVDQAAAAVQALARSAIDLGPPGRDLTYGYGLLGAEFAVDPRPLIGPR